MATADLQGRDFRALARSALTVSLVAVGVVLLLLIVYEARLAITLTVASALIAMALNHVVEWMARRGTKRKTGVGIVLAVVVLLLILGAVLLVPAAIQQGSALIESAPHFLQRVRTNELYQFLERKFHLESAASASPETLRATATPALKAIGGVFFVLGALLSVFFLTVFMLIFGGSLVREWLKEATEDHRLRYERVLKKIYESVGGYVSGLSFICLINATLTTTFLAIVRVPFFLPLGILSGFSSLIPYGGPITAGSAITLIALATRGPWVALATLIYFILYGQLEGQVLSPLIFRRTVHVNPLITLLAILFFAELAGVIGAVVAVPAAAALQIILREVLNARRERLRGELPA